MVLFKIALRNLREHKSKTLIIGIIVGLGIMILLIGNSMMDTATKGLAKTYWNNFTGHIMISGSTKGDLTLFGPQSMNSMNESIPKIPDYFKVKDYVSSLPGVEAVSPQAFGMSTIRTEGDDSESSTTFTQLFGIDPELYRKMFPDNLEITEGSFIPEGEEGLMLSEHVKEALEEDLGRKLKPGDKVLLTSMNDLSGMKIREVPIRGIFRFKYSNPALDRISLIDMQNLRVLNGMTVTAAKDIKLSKNEETMLNNVDDNSLFGGGASGEAGSASGSDISSDTDSDTGLVETATVQKKKYTESVLLNILGDKSVREKLSKTDSGAWHFLLIKLNNPARARSVIREINTYFKNNNINARAVDWLSGAGMIAQMSSNIKTIFNVIVLIIAIVAIIIMMNTIVISVTERIPEIGTMRAIGAQKSFIRRMIIVETLMVSVIFGIIGIALGGLVLLFLYLKGIPATNIFFQILFGGKVLHPVMSVQSLVLSLVVTATIGILASLYPVSVALKIQPVQAMQRT